MIKQNERILTRVFTTAVVVMTAISLSLSTVHAQKQLTLDDVIPGGRNYYEVGPDRLNATALTNVGVLHYKDNALKITSSSGKERDFMTPQQWAKLSGDTEARLPRVQTDPATGFVIASTGDFILVINPESSTLEQRYVLSAVPHKTFDLSVAANKVALMDGKNIFTVDRAGSVTQVTTDGSFDIVNGMAANRNEFGTNKGTFWSPSGRYLAYYHNDMTKVTAYPLVDITDPIAIHQPIKYPMAGDAGQNLTVKIYDTVTKQTQTIDTESPTDTYLTNIVWSPDEMHLYIDEVERSQKASRLVRYDIKSGRIASIIHREKNDRYVEPLMPIIFVPGRPALFIRASREDGYMHLYVHSNTGDFRKQLTSGPFEVKELLGIDKKGEWIYYISNEGYPIGQGLYRVHLQTSKREALTPQRGWHSIMLAPNCALAYDQFSNIDIPGESRLLSTASASSYRTLVKSKTPFRGYAMPEVRLGTIKAADGSSDLYYKMTLPPNMNPSLKYPTIVYVYGGPHAQLVTDSWSRLHQTWDNYMASQGYIVFTVDNRGSAARGMAFESIVYKHLGTHEMADQMKGIDYLKSLPYVDANRIGVHGWSFGGFMTTNLMLTHPDIFKVGVAGGPVMNWRYYEVMYGERYMSTPQENPEGYEASNLIKRAGDLQGRLLLIHGNVDPVVVWQHSLLFVRAAVSQRKLVDYMVYPGYEHNVIGPDRVHLYMMVSQYFKDHL